MVSIMWFLYLLYATENRSARCEVSRWCWCSSHYFIATSVTVYHSVWCSLQKSSNLQETPVCGDFTFICFGLGIVVLFS